VKSKKVRVGIVGAGRWAQASHLPSLAALKNVELSAISNLNYDSSVKIANRFNIKHVFKSWKELVGFKDLDAVIVLSPPKTHHPVTMSALKNKKHVLCEGPLAMNFLQAKEMLKTATDNSLVHGYIRPKLYIDGGTKIKQVILNGQIGEIQNVLVSWRPKVWLDKKTPLCWRHLISQSPPLLSVVPIIMLIEIFGPIRSVIAGYNIFEKNRYSEKNKRRMRVTTPDYFHSILDLKSGVRVTIEAGVGCTKFPVSGFYIFGTKGTLIWEWTLPNRILIGRPGKAEPANIPYTLNFKKGWKFDRDFVGSILHRSIPDYNFNHGVYEMKVIDAIQLSAQNKREILL